MASGYVHTVYKGGQWTNEVEGGDAQTLGKFDTKEMAVAAGRKRAIDRKTEHVIHDMDGSISDRNSYGNDPAHRPG
jgi:hypothetical protein